MSRQIEISTDVFAAIWAARKDGEESENEILSRLFNVRSPEQFQLIDFSELNNVKMNGFYDSRNDVHFPEGFIVFRHYKGQLFQAKATHGQWVRLDTEESYSSLNRLNESIAVGNENIWNGNWQYFDENGNRFSIDNLRK